MVFRPITFETMDRFIVLRNEVKLKSLIKPITRVWSDNIDANTRPKNTTKLESWSNFNIIPRPE